MAKLLALDETARDWCDGGAAVRVRMVAHLPVRVQRLLAAVYARILVAVAEAEVNPGVGRSQRCLAAAAKLLARTFRDPTRTHWGERRGVLRAVVGLINFRHPAADAALAACSWPEITAPEVAAKVSWGVSYTIFRHCCGPVGDAFDPRWSTETVAQLARGIYVDEAYDRMPILADALEEAGCDIAETLIHLRTPDAYFTRADWVLWNILWPRVRRDCIHKEARP